MFCQATSAFCDQDHLSWPARVELNLCATLVNGTHDSQSGQAQVLDFVLGGFATHLGYPGIPTKDVFALSLRPTFKRCDVHIYGLIPLSIVQNVFT